MSLRACQFTRFNRAASCLLFLTGLFCGERARSSDVLQLRSEDELIAVLRSGAAEQQALACKELAIRGGPRSCPELAKLLADVQLASWARIALEAIPHPAADAALRESVSKLDGQLAVGVINSIGKRRDRGAVALLAVCLDYDDPDADVASAAAIALGRIATPAAMSALRSALATASDRVLPAVADGYLLCADHHLKSAEYAQAIQIYDEVRATSVPLPQQLAATYGAILSRQEAGVPLLLEQLHASDQQFFRLGLLLIREINSPRVTPALLEDLASFSGDRAALILLAISERNESGVPEQVFAAARSGDLRTRGAAIDFIGLRGDQQHLDALLEIAAEGDAELNQRSLAAIARLPGEPIDQLLISEISAAQGPNLLNLIDAMGRRRTNATAELCQFLESADASIRSATLQALGESVSAGELNVLIRAVTSPRSPEDAELASHSLIVAASRMADPDACAAEIAAALVPAPPAAKVRLMQALSAVGGQKALEAIAGAMQESEELQDAGSRLLGEWMSVEAAPVLLAQVTAATNNKYQVRALRGYIRLARQFDMSAEERAEMCRRALELANRPEEQALVLAILTRYPDPEMLKIAVSAKSNPTIRKAAEQAIEQIVAALGRTPEVIAIVSGVEQTQK